MSFKEKFKALYAKFIALRNLTLDQAVDLLVNIKPLTETEHYITLWLVPAIFLTAVAINFGSVLPFTLAGLALWLWSFRSIFSRSETFAKWWNVWVAYISQPAPVMLSEPANEVINREAFNSDFRPLNHPRYGKGVFGFW